MRFPVVVFKSDNSDYGAWLPDFPGLYPLSKTLEGLLNDIQSAVEEWMEGQDPAVFPVPSTPEAVTSLPEAHGKAVFFVDVNTEFLDTSARRINITIPRYALGRIDRYAKQRGLTRSGYLVQAALSYT